MAEAKKEKTLKQRLTSLTKRKKKNKLAERDEVGHKQSENKTNKDLACVPLQQIDIWSDYATVLDAVNETPKFAVNETLNNKISLYFGDITTLQVDAIVTSSGPKLISIGDVGFSVHGAAGSELSSVCASFAASDRYCPEGDAVMTNGYKLPAKYVIHAVPPRKPDEAKLRSCYRSSLKIARDSKIRTIAFPAIATAFCGYDVTKATPVAVSTVREWLLEKDNMTRIDRVIFCVFTNTSKSVYEQNLLQYFPVDQQGKVPYEMVQDPYALALYEKATKEGKEADKVIRVNIVGNYGQGKTSLKRRLVGQSIDGIESTSSIDIDRYKCTQSSNGKVIVTFEKEDESQDLIDRFVEVALCAKADDDCVEKGELFDDDDGRSSISAANSTENRDHVTSGNADKTSEVHAGEVQVEETEVETKHPLEHPKETKRVLSDEELVSFTKELRNSNSQDDELKKIIDIWDFGGQFVYYATHSMFHSREAIYLLVVNLSVKLRDIITDEEFPGEAADKDMEYFVRFWMNSIHSFVGTEDGSLPPVILVGTHRDKLDGDVKQKCDAYFDQIREFFEGTKVIQHIYPKDFAVSNTDSTDESVENLLDEILQIGDKISRTVEIPAKWLPLEKALKEKRSMKIITFQEVMEIDAENEFPLSSENQVQLFLRYHHNKGTFFNLDGEPKSNFIVLDPQYLIDAFKCIITSERFCKKLPSIRDSWKKLITEGKLDNALIDTAWSKDQQNKFIKHKTVLLEFLKRHHIISEAVRFDEETGDVKPLGWYIVPSLLKDHSKTAQTDLSEFIKGRSQTDIRFVMEFENSSLLQTVYSRVLAALLGKWSVVDVQTPTSQQKLLLFENLAFVRINMHHAGMIELRRSSIELLLVSLCPSTKIDSKVADKFRRYCEAVVTHGFKHLQNNFDRTRKPYSKTYRCNHETHGLQGSIKSESMSTLDDSLIVPCPDVMMKHEICSEKALNEWFFKDEIEDVDETKILSERELGRVAQAVGKNWQILGIELGLKQVQIDHITANNNNEVLRIFDMLKSWKNQDPERSNMTCLVQALKDTKCLTVDWDEIRNIRDEMI